MSAREAPAREEVNCVEVSALALDLDDLATQMVFGDDRLAAHL